ncbi:hypothetical protein U9M48_014337 [Paspalum notatum var. saurae]|uniref:Cytochrome P450 n=1 Tax=Paspalum notatum var. saurae TaxID=547442 RepID=A0AAQ3T115_PASNO
MHYQTITYANITLSLSDDLMGLFHVSSASLPLPPGPAGLPLVGSALHFIGPFSRSPHAVLTGLAQTYGPIMSFRPGMAGDFVVVSSPAAAREALAENDAALGARFVPDVAHALAHSSESVFFLPNSSALWRRHRAVVGAHLSSGLSLGRTSHVRDRHARRLAENVRARSGTPVAVGVAVLGAVLDVVSNIAFSEDVAGARVQGGQMFKELIVAVLQDWTKPNVSDAFPFLAPVDLLGSRHRVSRGLMKLYKFFDDEFVERRLLSSCDHERHGDLLDVVLERHAKSELTRSEITKFFTDIFLASSNTSRITVEWAMALLLKHQDKMEKVQDELAENLGCKDFVEEHDLHKLPYLHAVIKETLRLQPPAPLLPRKVVTGDMSLGGFAVPVGTYVLVNLWAIGRDPAVWPDPEVFLPERFLGDQAANFRGLDDFAYKPFGAGRRVCPGLDFATRLVPLLLASLLHRVQWRLPSGMAPEDVDLRDRGSMVLELATPLQAVPVSTHQ